MKYYGMTNRGKLRKTNQDNYGIATNENGDIFAMVCDGIGGGRGGDVASRMAVDYFSENFAAHGAFQTADEVKAWLRALISEANRRIHTRGQEDPLLQGMGTTLCGILKCAAGTYVVNIGDSRVYALRRDGNMAQVTMDHTLVQDMLLHGELSYQEAANYPDKNYLTNALGAWETIRSDISTLADDSYGYLICSDGLHGYVSERVIQSIVMDRERDPALRVRKLIRAALDTGGYDNVTVILIDLEGESHSWQKI